MPDSPNKLSQFWQELKRRRVVHVIIVYTSAAFVIIELVGNVYEALTLPEWTPALTIIILAIGFPLAIIFSWIFDVTPEGIEKTKSVNGIKPGEKTVTPNSWKIASYISFVVIVGLVVLNIVHRSNEKEILDKSIAVLPFRNDSPDEEKMYFINGTMEAILDNLCKIEDLRIPSRTSVEQYRNISKSTPKIAEELNVSYVVEGSGQRLGNRVLLTIQLIEGKSDRHLWSKQYDREIKQIEDLLSIQSEIAQLVAKEIEAVITPEELQLIEKSPTKSIIAYEIYQKGNEEHWKYVNDNDLNALRGAENLFNAALEFDPAFALAYSGLAKVYLDRNSSSTILKDNYLDTVLQFTDLALSYDNQLAEAHTIQGTCYTLKGNPEQALIEFDEALAYNPNYWQAFREKGQLFQYGDPLNAILNYEKALALYHGKERPRLLNDIGTAYYSAGLVENGNAYYQEKLELDHDSSEYFNLLAIGENWLGNFRESLEYGKKAYAYDSTNLEIIDRLAYNYMFLGEYEKALTFYEKLMDYFQSYDLFDNVNTHRYAYIYWQTGDRKKAAYLFNLEIEYCLKINELGRKWEDQRYTFYDLAAVYAFLGEKDKAYENLRAFNLRQSMNVWMVTLIKNDPLFENIRDEPEFQQIVLDVEAKYQAEHERVRKWLEENDRL